MSSVTIQYSWSRLGDLKKDIVLFLGCSLELKIYHVNLIFVSSFKIMMLGLYINLLKIKRIKPPKEGITTLGEREELC